ncbi:MAG: TonB-dependent receptor [Pseudoxanthomonas sp.]
MRKYRRNALSAFVISNLAILPGQALAQDAATQQTEGDVTNLASVQVAGRRAADRLAVDDKRLSDNQVDSIRADDVGRLPDQSVAEAMRRLPGLSVSNDQGEARYLTVRGVSPDLLNVTLNGQSAPAPEPESRQVKLDDIPSALIGSVTVVKTLTPDLDANAIAGQVNIQTLSAFDRNRTFGTFRGSYGRYDQNGEHPHEFDASLGGVFGADKQFGAVIAINDSVRPIASQNYAGSPEWLTVNGHAVPDQFSIRHYQPNRERSGAVANFDWKASDSAAVFLRLMHSKYEDDEVRQHFGITMPTDASSYSDQTADSGDFTGARGERRVRHRSEDTSTDSGSLGGEFKFGEDEDHILKAEATFSQARKKDPHRDEWTFRTGNNVAGSYDVGSSLYRITPAELAYDPTAYRAYQVRYGHRTSNEDLFQARLDYQFPIAAGDGSWIKVGAKFNDRKKDNDEDRETWRMASAGTLTMDQVLGSALGPVFSGDRYGYAIDYKGADAYFAANPAVFTYRAADTLTDSLAADYRIREKVTAAYAMANLRFGDFTVIPGVRVENTKSDYAAKAVTEDSTLDQPFDSFGGKSYTDWFPSVNLRYDIGSDLVLRAAVTTAIGRPNYEDIAPYVIVEDSGGGDYEVTMGNPDLEALKSLNLDLSAEYYVGNRGLLSVAAFHKKIDNPIYLTTESVQNGTFAGSVLGQAYVTRPINATDATVRGIEFNAQYELSFLPSPFDGLSVGGSLTLVNSKANGVPNRPEGVPLPTQSDKLASFNLSYEKYGFSARLAFSHRSAMLTELGESADSDLYTDNYQTWDARVGYAFNDHFQTYLEGSNLNNARFRSYYGTPNHLGETESYGRMVRLGVQLTF